MSLARINWRELLARFGLVLALLALVIILSAMSDRFLTQSNIINVLRQISINAIIAAGMTVVIIGRGIDLSVGSLLALTGVVGASLAVGGLPAGVAIAAALGLGLAMGVFNGAFVAYAGIAPFIVTLAGLTIFRGMALAFTDGRPVSGLPPAFMTIGYGSFLGLPVPIWIMLGFLVVTHVILRYTALGRAVYAIGGNEEAARLSGIPVRRVVLFTFAYSGLAAAIASMVLTGRLNSAQPSAGVMFELDAIAAVVVGGTSLFGGKGGVFGTLIGALIIGVINNGMNLLNVPSFYQQIVKGGVILTALLIERLVSARRT
ncbi:MAG: ribose ABC transporter permease [Trueperaceae bacterium]|nr:MAG: ribose ABC transporter permease [Trueperaceae bacterium]